MCWSEQKIASQFELECNWINCLAWSNQSTIISDAVFSLACTFYLSFCFHLLFLSITGLIECHHVNSIEVTFTSYSQSFSFTQHVYTQIWVTVLNSNICSTLCVSDGFSDSVRLTVSGMQWLFCFFRNMNEFHRISLRCNSLRLDDDITM